jgi:hypothetical protein
MKIHHGLDSKQNIYTEHFHVHGHLIKEGDRVKRGQTIGSIGVGNRERTDLPHYHYIVMKEESAGKFVALSPVDYWFGIDLYKEKLEKELGIGPFAIACFCKCELPKGTNKIYLSGQMQVIHNGVALTSPVEKVGLGLSHKRRKEIDLGRV